jgi:hypothetical protein
MQRELEGLVLSLTYPHDIPLNQILFKCFFAPPVGSTTKRNINLTKENEEQVLKCHINRKIYHMLKFLMIRPPRKQWFDSSSSAEALCLISKLIVGLASKVEELQTRINTSVSNMGVCHQDKLTRITWVSQNLLVAAITHM